jgi:hypothetical protein
MVEADQKYIADRIPSNEAVAQVAHFHASRPERLYAYDGDGLAETLLAVGPFITHGLLLLPDGTEEYVDMKYLLHDPARLATGYDRERRATIYLLRAEINKLTGQASAALGPIESFTPAPIAANESSVSRAQPDSSAATSGAEPGQQVDPFKTGAAGCPSAASPTAEPVMESPEEPGEIAIAPTPALELIAELAEEPTELVLFIVGILDDLADRGVTIDVIPRPRLLEMAQSEANKKAPPIDKKRTVNVGGRNLQYALAYRRQRPTNK